VTDTLPVAAPYREIAGWEKIPEGFTHYDVAGVALDADDNVYLLTRLQARILVYDAEGNYLRSWGEGTFSNRPHGLTIGPGGTVYYVDEGEHIVRMFDLEGNELGVIGTPGVASDTGHEKSGGSAYDRVASVVRAAGPFNRPTALAVAPDGTLYVTDGYGNCRVHHFTADGELIHSWGEPGIGPGEFHVPHSLIVLPDGRVVVADRENDRIQVFDADGAFIEIWDAVQRPTDFALDPDGNLVVSELCWWPGERSCVDGPVYVQRPGRISVLDTDGRPLLRWLSEGDGRGPGQFLAPHGIAIDSRGDLYVGEAAFNYSRAQGITEPEVNSFHKFSPVHP
jgi:DNA-binding beta-propeller fold protein YncE